LANLKRVSTQLIDWTTEDGDTYNELFELYREMLGVWRRYINHVIYNIGGVRHTHKTTDQSGPIYEYVKRADQLRAIDFIAREVFDSPEWLIPPSITGLIGLSGSVDQIYNYQYDALKNLLRDDRMFRLSEAAVYDSDTPTVSEVVQRVGNHIFTINPDRMRRQLQRQYIELLIAKTDSDASELLKTSDLPAIYRLQLYQMKDLVSDLSIQSDGLLKAHYEDLLYRITHSENAD